jgi:DNA-binding NarL/FixJ family response regulator
VNAPRPHRIAVVDDHPLVRLGIRRILADESDLELCGEADGAAAALSMVRSTCPDLVIVDLTLADGSGLGLVKQLTASDSSIKVLVSSMHDEAQFAERALRAGAMGYISKGTAIEHLVAAIRRVLAGSIYLSQAMTDRLLRSITQSEMERGQATLDRLSDRELEVFELLGRGMTTRDTAEHLHLSVKTVETYRENLKTKLNLEHSNELICRAAQWVASS